MIAIRPLEWHLDTGEATRETPRLQLKILIEACSSSCSIVRFPFLAFPQSKESTNPMVNDYVQVKSLQ